MQGDAWMAAALEAAGAWRAAAETRWLALTPESRAIVAFGLAALAGALLTALLWARPARRRARRLAQRLAAESEARRAAEAELAAERRAQAARIDEIREMEARLERSFAGLAAGALDRNAERFLGLVSERFEGHRRDADATLAARQAAVEALVRPVRETLGAFEKRVGEIETARADAYGELRSVAAQLREGQTALRDETGRLVQALRAPKTRGRWGEFQLRQVLEMAGMAEHVDFETEVGHETDDGPRRPDARLNLPGGKCLVVDAKTPLDAYLTALEAEPGSAAQSEALDAHARQARVHARALGAKAYWNALPEAPDLVVMFVPGEAFYAAAVERDPALFEDALARRVLIASPTTLIALAKSVAYGWQQAKLADGAREIAETARVLYDRLRGFGEHLDGAGKALAQAVERYNRAIGALEGRVLPSARRFEDLGVAPEGARVEPPRTVEHGVRGLAAADLARAAE
ncbi:MAG: DNA recombination protein RmuC [Paracoccaceae bacterium]